MSNLAADGQAEPSSMRWGSLIAFSSPLFAFAGEEVAFKVFLPLYLAQMARYSLASIALILLLYRVWDTLNDPLVGWLSDHWRWGHRRFVPMLIGTPIALVSSTIILLMPHLLSPVGIATTLFFVALGWTLVNVPHGAWALEFAPDPIGRTRVFASRQLVGLCAIPLFALGPSVLDQLYGASNQRQAMILTAIMVIALPLSLLWLRLRVTHEPVRVMPPPPAVNVRMMLAIALQRRSLYLLLLFVCLGIHAAIKDGLILFWVQYSLHLPDWGWSVILVQSFIGLLSIPIWVRLQARLGATRALRLSLGLTWLSALSVLIVPTQSVPALIGFSVASGIVFGSSFTLLRTLLGDHFDLLNARNNTNLAGTLYSGFHLAYNLALAFAASAALELLARLGFDAHATPRLAHAAFDPLVWVIGLGAALPVAIAFIATCLSRDVRTER